MFYGRFAMKVEYLASLGDRVPGTTGEEAVIGLFGKVPDGHQLHPDQAPLPVIAVKFPYAFLHQSANPPGPRRGDRCLVAAQIPRVGVPRPRPCGRPAR